MSTAGVLRLVPTQLREYVSVALNQQRVLFITNTEIPPEDAVCLSVSVSDIHAKNFCPNANSNL